MVIISMRSVLRGLSRFGAYGAFLNNLSFIKRYFAVRRSDIAYLRFIIESYEGLATLSTVDGKAGTVSLSIPRCFADEADGLVRALEKEIAMKEIMFHHGNAGHGESHGGRENNGNA